MNRIKIYTAILFSLFLWAGQSFAKGTPAGTTISNTASVTYTIGSQPFTVPSAPSSFKVAQLVNLSAVWQDGANIPVATGDTNKILTFRVTNTGNGTDTLALSINDLLAGDNFDPSPAVQAIWLDSNGSGHYDTGDSAATTVTLAPDASATVFVLNNIPLGQSDGATGLSQLVATSGYGAAPIGTIKAGAGPGGIDVVIGTSAGTATANGTYQVSALVVSILKGSTIVDPFGTAEPVPGAVVTYTLTVRATGTGTAKGVTVTDPIPANTTYKTGSLTFNGVSLSDSKDADAGDVGGTTPDTATVTVGDLTQAMGAQTVTFKVTINQ